MLLVEARMVTVVNEETGQDEDKFFLDSFRTHTDRSYPRTTAKYLAASTQIDAQLYARLRRLDGYRD